jgi:hypothetical protein
MLDKGYAVLMLVKRVAGDGVSFDEAKTSGALQRLVRMNQERLLMDQLARRLMAQTTVTIFDDSLNESWSRAKGKR